MSEFGFDPEAAAAAAARDAPEPPTIVVNGTTIGESLCGEQFLYGLGTDLDNFSDCPSCGSQQWGKWGYHYDGEDIHHSEVDWGGESE